MITYNQLIVEGLAAQLIPMALMGVGASIGGIGSLLGGETMQGIIPASTDTINNLKSTGATMTALGMAGRLASTADMAKTMIDRQRAMNNQTPQQNNFDQQHIIKTDQHQQNQNISGQQITPQK